MSKHVLITRPQAEAEIIAAALRGKGYACVCQPFLNVQLYNVPFHNVLEYQALIFTSANAVRAYHENGGSVDVPIITVGNNTFNATKEIGFVDIINLNGTAKDVLEHLNNVSASKPYLHVRGKYVTTSFVGMLKNVKIEEIEVYRTEKIEQIPNDCVSSLAKGGFSYVLFFSRRTAEAFIEFIKKNDRMHELEEGVIHTKALCLGHSMIECISVLPWKKIEVADHPNREGMLALLD